MIGLNIATVGYAGPIYGNAMVVNGYYADALGEILIPTKIFASPGRTLVKKSPGRTLVKESPGRNYIFKSPGK